MSRKSVAVAAIAVALGISLAVALTAGPRGASAASSMGAYSTGVVSPAGVADTGTTTVAATTTAGVDPAKQEPVLDKFTSKDPFYTSTLGDAPAAGTSTPAPSSSSQPTAPVSAKVKVNSTSYTVSKGDKVPTSTPVFTISALSSQGVTFALISGQFDDGTSSVQVAEGTSVDAVSSTTHKTYTLSVTSLVYASDSGSNTSSSTGHTLKVVSINTLNGENTATFVVDGKTYADKGVSDTFSTAAGQIKVVSINSGSQSVAILRGDESLTLHTGQSVIK
jgi:hypothetical protein